MPPSTASHGGMTVRRVLLPQGRSSRLAHQPPMKDGTRKKQLLISHGQQVYAYLFMKRFTHARFALHGAISRHPSTMWVLSRGVARLFPGSSTPRTATLARQRAHRAAPRRCRPPSRPSHHAVSDPRPIPKVSSAFAQPCCTTFPGPPRCIWDSSSPASHTSNSTPCERKARTSPWPRTGSRRSGGASSPRVPGTRQRPFLGPAATAPRRYPHSRRRRCCLRSMSSRPLSNLALTQMAPAQLACGVGPPCSTRRRGGGARSCPRFPPARGTALQQDPRRRRRPALWSS